MLTVFMPAGEQADAKALAQMEMVMADERVIAGALCADHHLGYSMPIGGVVAYDGAISPSGVGFDIGCGNKAVRTNLQRNDLMGVGAGRRWTINPLMDEIQNRISFGMGRSNPHPIDHELFDEYRGPLGELDRLSKRYALSQKARAQLGTVGGGNHYVDVLADEDGWVWIACHFGSRGLGHTIATGFLNLAANKPFSAHGKEQEEPTVLPVDSDLGAFYLEAMHLAGAYAYAGRDYVIDQVLGILGVQADLEVHNHHNFAWLENGLWVIRKGATPLTREPAFIGGSMGDGAVIVVGRRDSSLGEESLGAGASTVVDIGALGSAPHGAGRVMSRTQAAGKQKRSTRYGCTSRDCDFFMSPQEHDKAIREVDPAERERGVPCPAEHGPVLRGAVNRDVTPRLRKFTHLEKVRDGVVDWPNVQAELRARNIELRGGDADEAPEVYKNLDAVIAAHSNIEVLHRLVPLGVVMASAGVFDPYKD